MSDRAFVDTNVLVYAHDVDAGERHVVAARLVAEQQQLSFWDALIVAAALKGGASTILSEDLSPGRTISGVRIENPFAPR